MKDEHNNIDDLITNKVKARGMTNRPTHFVQTEDIPRYNIVKPDEQFYSEVERHADDETIRQALNILVQRLQRTENVAIGEPKDTKNYLSLKLGEREHEVFAVMFLDNRHRLIKYEEMFRGTIDGASVYPREVVKRALELNAAALILAHNHPSGVPEPSRADEQITHRLKEACGLVEIRVIDHVIIGGAETVSLVERGIL